MSQEGLMLGTIIRQICDIRGISVRQCERMAGIPERTINRWDTNEPGIGKVTAVAKALGMTLDELVNYPIQKENPAENGEVKNDAADKLIQSEKDQNLLAFFRSLPPEKLQAILISQDGPEGLV